MSGTPPTPAEAKVLTVYRYFSERGGQVPTISRVANAVKRSRPTVFEHIRNLAGKGMLKRISHGGQSRYVLAEVCPACGHPLSGSQEPTA